MRKESADTLVEGAHGCRLAIDPATMAGMYAIAGNDRPGWTFDPLAYLRFTDREGRDVPWTLESVGAGSGGPATVEARVSAGANRYRLSSGLDSATGELLLELSPLAEPDPIGAVAFPGPFLPVDGVVTQLVLPLLRTNGAIHRPCASDHWVATVAVATHSGLNMPFWGLGAGDQGLLAIVDTPDDATLDIVKVIHEALRVGPVWRSSLGRLRYPRRLRLAALTEDSYVAMALAYRRHVQREGRFRSLAEKIEERPGVAQVVGGPYFSLGYLPFSERKFRQVVAGLREIGYTNGLIGPIDHIQWASGEWLNDYQPFIHAPHFAGIAADHGFAAFSWLYLEDILRWDPYFDSEWLLRREDGETVEGWFNRDYEYFQLCTRVLLEQHRQLKDRVARFDALHFDTTTAKDLTECWHPEHPMTRTQDREARRARLEEVAGWNSVIGSEAGSDWAFDVMDFCSNNPRADLSIAMPVLFVHVPLLGLVYHDAIVSYCWEYDPYNPSYLGGDWSRQKLLFDAMAGNPPTVSPVFGYFPVIRRPAPPVSSHWVMWEDAQTQRLLRDALPVAQLHGRTAHTPMIDHELLSEDGLVSRTTYADGTDVLVNRSEHPWDDGQATIGALDYRVS
jgi:hypothetical protein